MTGRSFPSRFADPPRHAARARFRDADRDLFLSLTDAAKRMDAAATDAVSAYRKDGSAAARARLARLVTELETLRWTMATTMRSLSEMRNDLAAPNG